MENGEDRVSIIDMALKQKAGLDEIKLYEQLSLAMELMEEKNFEIISENVGNGRVNFEIATDFPNDLPFDIGILFFNADLRYKVNIHETQCIDYFDKRFFEISLKKE